MRADRADDDVGVSGDPGETDPEWHRDEDGRTERERDQKEMARRHRRQRPSLRAQIRSQVLRVRLRTRPGARATRGARRGPCEPDLPERVGRDDRHGYAVDFQPPVERAHLRHANAIAQLREHRDRRRVVALQGRTDHGGGFVRRIEVPVVAEDDEIVPGDQSVGREPINDIDAARGERRVLHRGQQCPDVVQADAVDTNQSGQSVRPSDEIGRESPSEPRARSCQVAQRREMQGVGRAAAHRDGVGVLEAQWGKPSHAVARGGRGRDLGEDGARIRLRR